MREDGFGRPQKVPEADDDLLLNRDVRRCSRNKGGSGRGPGAITVNDGAEVFAVENGSIAYEKGETEFLRQRKESFNACVRADI